MELVDTVPLHAILMVLQLGNRSVGESLLRQVPDHTIRLPLYWEPYAVNVVEPRIYKELLCTCFEHRKEVLSTGIDGNLYIDGPGFARRFDWDKAFTYLAGWQSS